MPLRGKYAMTVNVTDLELLELLRVLSHVNIAIVRKLWCEGHPVGLGSSNGYVLAL